MGEVLEREIVRCSNMKKETGNRAGINWGGVRRIVQRGREDR